MVSAQRYFGTRATVAWIAAVMAIVSIWMLLPTGMIEVRAQEARGSVPWPAADRPAYSTSPYHGAVDGDGRVIPCRCRFLGHEFRVGEEVCMSTHAGVVMARCDLMLNNTTWVPTTTACILSHSMPDGTGTMMAGVR